ncbi:aldehyde dehydrogenase family protein [Streptodolium elevatio]|uniref:aldehyde dehydrogenase (NAD(+)) n=1 Tax=Streptodolium elevatio TaxID=3157996 RepID=A0ABV3DNT6_9ACTN
MADHLEVAQLYVDGKFVDGRAPAFAVEDPATAEEFAHCPAASPDQFDEAVAAARRSFDAGVWASVPVPERVKVLAAMADELDGMRDDLLRTVVRETGTPVRIAGLMQVDMALEQARQLPALLATLPEWEHNELPLEAHIAGPTGRDVLTSVRRYEPCGVVAAITPYNFPLQPAVWKVFAALAAGCSVILRPSPLTPLSVLAFGVAADRAGLPPGVLAVVPEPGAEGAELLTSDPRVDCVSFTGSTAVGRRIAAQAAPTVKRLVLELGGKSVQLYLPDAVRNVAAGVGTVFASHAGQACSAQSRVLVPADALDAAVEQACAVARAMPVGDPQDPATVVGPLISAAQHDRVTGLVDDAVRAGARLAAGGRRPAHLPRGHYLEPTVLVVDDNANPIAQQEAFGPVVSIHGYRDLDEAVAIANDSQYGLSGGVYSADVRAGLDVARRIRSGTVLVNRPSANAYTPMGGIKQSGIGRERGVAGLREYQEIQHLVLGPLDSAG